MITSPSITWSKTEKKLARQAFEKAYNRELQELTETDRKYDFRYSVLITVFAQLHAEGRLTLEDLKGLAESKIEIIKNAAGIRLSNE